MKKNKRLRAIEKATNKLTSNYLEKWIKFVETNCKLCNYSQFINKEFGCPTNTKTYPNKCLYWNHSLKPLIKMHLLLQINCPYCKIDKTSNHPNIIVKQTEYQLLL